MAEIGPVVLEKKILKFRHCIFRYLVIISPLGKGRGPLFEQTWAPFTQGCFVPSLVEIGPVVLGKKIYRQIDDERPENLTWVSAQAS